MSEEVLTATHDVAYWQRRALQAEQREAITADAYNQQQSSYRELETLYQASQERALRAEGAARAVVDACEVFAAFVEDYTPDSPLARMFPGFYADLRVHGKSARAEVEQAQKASET